MPASEKQKILIVDDDRHLLLTLTDYLKFKGYETSSARSAEDALVALETHIPDLVILDIGMPGIGGMGFLREIQRRKQNKIPILILTAKAIMEDFFSDLGVDGFVAKPCSEDDLLRKIKEILSRHTASLTQASKRDSMVLLVEDDSFITDEIRRAFRTASRRLDLLTANTAAEAIEKTVKLKPDLVMTNEVLRGMNGNDMARLVRQMPGVQSTPIIIYRKTSLSVGQWIYEHRIFGKGNEYLAATDSLSLHDAACHILHAQ